MGVSNEIALLWNGDIDRREAVLKAAEHQENAKHLGTLVADSPTIQPLFVAPHSPSKYANAKYSHAVAANHPWRTRRYHKPIM